VREGRLLNGPWYILQDEFLTSGEANLRNLQIGHRDAARIGPVAKIGYFPDSFGNMGQAPQLLRQAGIDNAVFGRGVKPTGANNVVTDGEFESPYSEMFWQSPDGSRVLGILFANWYHNGMEIPTDPEGAKAYWEKRIASVERYASTPHLLFMNGCDHQPVQKDVTDALHTARGLFPGITFHHSNFPDYVRAVQASIRPEALAVVRGELRSQRTDGWGTLVNTASARVYIKQANQANQSLLEKVAEPLATIASALGQPYPHAELTHAWKLLMQNHPHDSICGCSVDEVHREMMTRFAKSTHVAEGLIDESAAAFVRAIDTSRFAAYAGAVPFVALNSSGFERSGVVSVELELERRPLYEPSPADIADGLATVPATGRVVDADGRDVYATVEDLGVRFGYTLPDDRFRQPYMARAIRVTLLAERVPPLGFRAYAWVPGDAAETASAPAAAASEDGRFLLENDALSVAVAADGTYDLLDKATGRVYRGLGVFEDVGDIGNEYVFKQPDGESPLTTKGVPAELRYVERSPLRTVVEVVHRWAIPARADDTLAEERRKMVNYVRRKAQRVAEVVPLTLTTRLTLEAEARALQVSVAYDNRATDHRLRLLFPSDIDSDVHYADSVFEVAARSTTPAPEWRNPSNAQHQQSFVAVDDASAGLAVLNRGLNEYEVLRDGRGTIAVTLLRAVGELGDWGVFPTPEAQCLGPQVAELAVAPYAGAARRADAAVEASLFQTPWTVRQTDAHAGPIPAAGFDGWLRWTGASMLLSSVKANEANGDWMARWYNLSGEPTTLTVRADGAARWYRSNVLEERLEPLETDADGTATLAVGPAEIVTLGCARA
ncbi:MAG TPA: alpha-mannosidase, partial [Paenibacillus sp.]|nr:alpha-mannosidase [Paenibacillus sp.]